MGAGQRFLIPIEGFGMAEREDNQLKIDIILD
jgi:hypothetical protein